MLKAASGMHELENRILKLKQVHDQQLAELHVAAAAIFESISPIGILRSALSGVSRSPDLRKSAISTAIGIGAGFLGKKIYEGNSKSIFKKIAGTAIQFFIANFVRKKIPEIVENNLNPGRES